MPIVKLPKAAQQTVKSERALEAFINGAPDGGAPRKLRGKTKKSVLITLTVDPEMLAAFDGIVESEGVSRASGIKILLKRAVAKGTLF